MILVVVALEHFLVNTLSTYHISDIGQEEQSERARNHLFPHYPTTNKTHMSSTTSQGFACCHKIRHSRSFSALGDDASCLAISCSSQQLHSSTIISQVAPRLRMAGLPIVATAGLVLVLFSKSCLVQRYFISKASFSKRRQRLKKRPLQEPYFFPAMVALISCIHKCQ